MAQVLGDFREAMVLVGGWVPELRLSEPRERLAIEGRMPDGRKNRIEILVTSIESFLVMKSFALTNRDKPKDAYDIYFCLLNYPGGVSALAERIRPHMDLKEVKEGLQRLESKFRSPDDYGAQSVVTFLNRPDQDERAYIARDVYEHIDLLLRILGIRYRDEEKEEARRVPVDPV